jgi:hypothetical protein
MEKLSIQILPKTEFNPPICDSISFLPTFRISFRLHQKRHLEEARHRGAIDGEEDKSGSGLKKRSPKKQKKIATTSSTSIVKKASPAVNVTSTLVDVQVNYLSN